MEAKQTLLFSGPIQGANILQIFSLKNEARDHITFNLSQTFKTHPFTTLLKLLSCLCLYSTRPQIYIKSESKIQIFWSETIFFLENGGGGAWDGDITIVHWQKEIGLRCYWIKIRNSRNKSASVAQTPKKAQPQIKYRKCFSQNRRMWKTICKSDSHQSGGAAGAQNHFRCWDKTSPLRTAQGKIKQYENIKIREQ